MEYLWIVILAPLIVAVGLAIACRLRHPRSFCKSTSEIFRSALRDNRGEDLVEYALMAFFVAAAASALMPGVAVAIQNVFAKICATLGGTSYTPMSFGHTGDLAFWIRIACAILAVVLLGVIVLRRRKNPRY